MVYWQYFINIVNITNLKQWTYRLVCSNFLQYKYTETNTILDEFVINSDYINFSSKHNKLC